ncbi:hypothetical protein [Yinghuangia sp. YIM S10712]|uniref:hypothetical protein n=1 Tax=Yinghuangia sp. YIM S10712 TaxID=3436930 RepID=UPI003F53192B
MSQQPYQYEPYMQQYPPSIPQPPPRRRSQTAAWTAGIIAFLVAVFLGFAMSAGDDGPKQTEVTRDGYEATGRIWPLTVDSATLGCEGGKDQPVATVTTAEGTTYGLNGVAMPDHPALAPIWRLDPEFPGLRVDVSDLLVEALGLC